jgi:hypothetical protein
MSQPATLWGNTVQTVTARQCFFVAGEAIELWEDPRLPFGCAFTDLEAYFLTSRWELLFNAIVLACLSRLDEDEDERQQRRPRWSWAFAAQATSDEDDRAGH